MKIYTLGRSNGDGSVTIKCFPSETDHSQWIVDEGEDEEEMEIPYDMGESEIILEGDTFRPFNIYADGI